MNSKKLVEQWREHGPATGATLLEIAVSAGMPDDKRVKWIRALQYASTVADRAIDHIAAQDARIEALEGALQFYANNASYCMIYGFAEGDLRGFAPVLQDDGAIAKAALGGEQHGG